jgi:hypothetical protein
MRAVPVLAFAAVALFVVSCTENKILVKNEPGAGEGLPGGPRESVPCTKAGAATFAIDAFDVTPDGADGAACDVANVLDEDDSLTGIARTGGGKATLVGHDVNGCIGVQFGTGVTISSLIMKMRPLSGTCGHACTTGGSNGCGTGWKVGIYVGPGFDKLQYLQQLSLTQKDLFEYRVAVHSSYRASHAVLCREATPESGDDIGIDIISGLCGEPPKD